MACGVLAATCWCGQQGHNHWTSAEMVFMTVWGQSRALTELVPCQHSCIRIAGRLTVAPSRKVPRRVWQRIPVPIANPPASSFPMHCALAACLAISAGIVCQVACRVRRIWRWRRPYPLRTAAPLGEVQNVDAELYRVYQFLHDKIVKQIDKRFPGRPFSADLASFPNTPSVLVVGNHSSGKSTFINDLCGKNIQETGLAPTDDGFTIIERADHHQPNSTVEDGPTILGCPENTSFRELQTFGDAFLGTFRRKRVILPDDSDLPAGVQIIDSPGMIDTPGHPQGVMGRGYNFVAVVRWLALRSDLILIMFDPDKPGTTGESLEVLTKSLAGLEHKFRIVLNKADQLDSIVDFARAYGTLSWSLSKVVLRKDIPHIFTICNKGYHVNNKTADAVLPVESFLESRDEVVEEVVRVKERHYDNVVTNLERTLRQIDMVANILPLVRVRTSQRTIMAFMGVWVILSLPAFAILYLYKIYALMPLARVIISGCYGLLGMCSFAFFASYVTNYSRLQSTGESLDRIFHDVYGDYFLYNQGEDYHARWAIVRPKVVTILKSLPRVAFLPIIARWEARKIKECIDKDVWHLRQLARAHRLSMQKQLDPSELD